MGEGPDAGSGVYYRPEDYIGIWRRLLIDAIDIPVAVALTVYDRLFGRPGAVPPEGDLGAADQVALRANWYTALAHGNPALLERYRAHLAQPVEPRPRLALDRRAGASQSDKKPGTP